MHDTLSVTRQRTCDQVLERHCFGEHSPVLLPPSVLDSGFRKSALLCQNNCKAVNACNIMGKRLQAWQCRAHTTVHADIHPHVQGQHSLISKVTHAEASSVEQVQPARVMAPNRRPSSLVVAVSSLCYEELRCKMC